MIYFHLSQQLACLHHIWRYCSFLFSPYFFFQFLYYLWVHLYFYRQWWIHLYYLWTSNQIIMMDFMLHRNRQIGYSDSLMAHFISASQYIQNYQLLNYCCWLIQVPTIDQGNGIYGTEPTETLLTFRSDEVLHPSHKNKWQVIVSCSSFHLFRSIGICVWPCKFYFTSSCWEPNILINFSRCTLVRI